MGFGPTPADHLRLVGSTIVGLGVVSMCALIIAKLLDDVMGGDDAARADPVILQWVVEQRTPALTRAAQAVTHLGDTWIVVSVVTITATALARARRYRLGVFVAAASAGAGIATLATKYVVDRPRPPEALWLAPASGPAFPSGHATQSVACFSAIAVAGIVLAPRSPVRIVLAATAVAIALGVGSSRIYLAVHWPSDVLCGWAVATLWVVILVLAGWARPRLTALWTGDRSDAGERAEP